MALLTAACFRNEKTYPFLADARAALAAHEYDRAYGAARAVLDSTRTIDVPPDDVLAAQSVAAQAKVSLGEQRLARAKALPRTPAGLVERMELLVPVIRDEELRTQHDAARLEIAETLLVLWEGAEPEIVRENYASALDAISRYRTFIPSDHRLNARLATVRARFAREHEARAEESPGDDTGLAMKRYHLARAAALGASHQADVERLDQALRLAIGVAYVVTKVDAAGDCASHQSAIASALAAPGKHAIELAVVVKGCAVSRNVSTSTKTRTYEVPVEKKRMAEVQVLDGYMSESFTSEKNEYCFGNAANGGQTCSVKKTTTTRQIPQYHTELREVTDTVYEKRNTTYPVTTKTKHAALTIEVTASFDGKTKSIVASGSDDFQDTQVSGDSGGSNRRFGAEPADATMLLKARREALSKAVDFARSLGPDRLGVALDTYERSAAGDPLREEAAHTVVVWALEGGARYERSKAWLGERWGQRAPDGRLAVAISAFQAPFSEKPFGDYPHETPTPPEYFNVAQGVGYLVTRGLSFEAIGKQASLDADRTQVTGGAAYGLGNGTHALRLGASGSSSTIAGDAYGYALGAAYARSLRGAIDETRRVEVVASLGAEWGAAWIDGGAGDAPAKERFLRAPFAVNVGVPFYVVTLHAGVSIAPNFLGLGDNAGFRSIHPLSGWLGVAPVRWIVVDGGIELPFGAVDVSPRFGARVGIRL